MNSRGALVGEALRLNELMLKTGQVLYQRLTEVVAFGLDKKTLGTVDVEDRRYLDNMPEGDKLTYLYKLERDLLVGGAAKRESGHGLAQTQLDALAHEAMKSRLEPLVRDSLVAGEEAKASDWDKALAAPSGTYVWILDAIDGSGPQDTAGFGYSSNALLYRVRDGRPAKPVMSVTVTSSALMLGWIEPGTVGAAYLNVVDDATGQPTIAELVQPLASLELVTKERRNWIAVVAAQPEQRSLVQCLFDSDRWVVMTLGGAPAMPGLLVDLLAAVVIPNAQTRHDAAPLLALASGMGITFIDIADGQVYSDAQVRDFFLGLERPGVGASNPLYKPVPAMVVGRDPDTAAELAEEIRSYWAARAKSDQRAASSGTGGSQRLRIVQDPLHGDSLED